MSNYTKSTNFATKDNLTPGDPLKVVRGTEIDTEYNDIATAIATKTDGAASSTDNAIARFDSTTGKIIQNSVVTIADTTGDIVGTATQGVFNTVSTTVNAFGAATAVNLGAATGTATVNNTTLAAKAITASATLAVTGAATLSSTLAVTGTSTLTGAVTATSGVTGPITSSSVSITGGSITGITDLAVADGGTGASTANNALNNLLPSQTGNANKYLQTDGTNSTWDAVSLSTADITGTLGVANGGTGVTTSTGTTNVVLSNSPTLVTPILGTPTSATLTNATGLPISTGVSGLGTGVATFLATPSSANLAAALTDETGTGSAVFATSPTLVTPVLGVATGTSFQGIIGNVTPAAGSFTTLGASSTATLNTLSSSGATLTGGTINGMTVGATTATTGAFTTVTASTPIGTASGGTGLGGATPFTSGGVVYASSTSALATGSALNFNGTNEFKVISASSTAYNRAESTAFGTFAQHFATSGGAGVEYKTLYRFVDTDVGELMRLNSTGLGIGTSSPSTKLHINNASATATYLRAENTNGYALFGVDSNGNAYAGAETNDAFGLVTNGTYRLYIEAAGNVGIGTSSPTHQLDVVTTASTNSIIAARNTTATDGGAQLRAGNPQNIFILATDSNGGGLSGTANASVLYSTSSTPFIFMPAGTEKMRLTSGGNLFIGRTSDTDAAGLTLESSGFIRANRDGGTVMIANRNTDDGLLVSFRQAGTEEGNISVSGTTVSYNGGHLSRWAQTTTAKDESLVKGTVLSNLDEMNVYTKDGQPVDNEQLNKVKVSDTEGDANVAGVFVNWSHDEDHNVDEINMAMTGDMIIRIAQGTTVVRGDLLMSAGDGTAKPQGDDIIRSKTVAKVTSNHVTCTYADGSYCVPCVLMAC